jgi:hypothetical protein
MLSDVGLAATAVAARYRVVTRSIGRWVLEPELEFHALTP